MIFLTLTSPLFTDWSEQYVRLYLASVEPGTALDLAVDGTSTPFQFTGKSVDKKAEILVKIGFAKDQIRHFVFSAAASCNTDLTEQEIPFTGPVTVGSKGSKLVVTPEAPFAGFAGFPLKSKVHCEKALIGARLVRIGDGPLFTDYRLRYEFEEDRAYALRLRCYKVDLFIEVEERFSLRKGSGIVWTINPDAIFTHIVSRDSFEGESQPSVEPLGEKRMRDVLCRLQMPVLTEYFIPNNRGWFAFYDQRNESRGMLGILGLYGAQWEEPVVNMPEVYDRDGTVEWQASLESGVRHWLLYAGPVETNYTPQRRFIFHRLHAEFNALRLDEHLDLDGSGAFDRSCWREPGVMGSADFHARARHRLEQYPRPKQVAENPDAWLKANGAMHLASFAYLSDPSEAHAQALHGHMITRFEKWVCQFQGYRTGENDYMKNVIGFSRYLRGLLLAYEMLRRDEVLTPEEVCKLNAYFVFAARRILDEGRWPHSRTMLHPDHPESTRDFYTYGGEHRPDRLHWTNCLPNFQSDPLCALAHLSAVFKDHPDAGHWMRFALEDIDRQLDAYCGKSGAWEESILYAIGTFGYFVITFKAVKERWGIDYFNDERVRRFASWLCRFLGPFDKRFGTFTMPGVGNAVSPQSGGPILLCYAAELDRNDPLRADCLAVWQRAPAFEQFAEHHYLLVMAAMAPEPEAPIALRKLQSEVMDEVGISLRDRHTQAEESYLFQKIGFAKDHYEADESAFNWYAKGTPFCMDYGTYTGHMCIAAAHNLVEIPDMDPLRRGYIAGHLFTEAVDFTHCEVPVTLKLMWDHVRSFAEVDGADGAVAREKTPYFYIGDRNPVGPKCWKVRKLLFVKPDYVVLFDRIYGEVPHRYNLHFTGTRIERKGQTITAKGRFDLDLLALVRYPAEFRMETGELIPNLHPAGGGEEARKNHAQHFFRLYNQADGIYLTLLFSKERSRHVELSGIGERGMKVVTPEYTDYVFLHNDIIHEETAEAAFNGRAGWIRRWNDGRVQACLVEGDMIQAFGLHIEGRGPWSFNSENADRVELHGGAPRAVKISIVAMANTGES